MRIFCRAILVAALVLSLANVPMANAADRALGFVLQAESSRIDGVAAANGSNVFSGDTLSTNRDGRIHLQFGEDQLYLPGSSAVQLASGKDGLLAILSSGTLEFASPRGRGVAVSADDVLVRPHTPQVTNAQVTLLSKDELKIAAATGSLDLELDGKSYTLAAGHTYGVRIVNRGESGTYQPRRGRNDRNLVIFLFSATATVAAVIYIVQELNESPEVP